MPSQRNKRARNLLVKAKAPVFGDSCMSNGLHQYQAFITHKGFHDCHVMQSRSQTKRQRSSRKTSPSNLKSLSQWHAIQMRRIRQLRETKEFSCCATVCRGVYSQPARTLPVLSTKTSGEVKQHEDDLYYSWMREEYTLCAHTYTKDMPKTFTKLMKNTTFSQTSQLSVKFPIYATNLLPSILDQYKKQSSCVSMFVIQTALWGTPQKW